MIAGLAWAVTPRLCRNVETIARDYELYRERSIPTSAGTRLEFWTKSLNFIREAPIVGHGTGSIRGLFERAASGPAVTASGQVVGKSAQPDPERRYSMGRCRGDCPVCDVVGSLAAVSRRRPGGLDRAIGRRAECLHLAVQFAPVRFSRGMDVRARRWDCRGNGVEDEIGRMRGNACQFLAAMTAGLHPRDKLSAARMCGNLDITGYWPAE